MINIMINIIMITLSLYRDHVWPSVLNDTKRVVADGWRAVVVIRLKEACCGEVIRE